MFSIIIPVYNAELFIKDAVESVLRQSYNDYELVIVDDASSDGTVQVLQNIIKNDDRVRIVRKSINEGELLARKTGVEYASGDYVLFLDADDEFKSDALEKLYMILYRKSYDIINFGVEIVPEEDVDMNFLQAAISYFIPYNGELNGEDIFLECYRKKSFSHNVWDKVYKMDICKKAFQKITNMDMPIAADLYTNFVLCFFSKSFCGIKDELYRYHVGRGITGQSFMSLSKFEKHCKQINVTNACKNFLLEYSCFDEYQDIYQSILYDACVECVNCYMRNISAQDSLEAYCLLVNYWGKEIVSKALKIWGKILVDVSNEYYRLSDEYQHLAYEYNRLLTWKMWRFPYDKVQRNSSVVLYGIGNMGRDFVEQIQRNNWCNIRMLIDQKCVGETVDGMMVSDINELHTVDYDYLVIAIYDTDIKKTVKEKLVRLGVEPHKII